jgi:hypothetical protein
MRSALRLASASLLIAVAAPAFAVDDGPRAYFPVPVGTNNFNLIGIFQSSNSSLDPATALKDADLDVDVGVLQYTRAFSVAGNASAIAIVAPYGEVSGKAVFSGPLGNNTITRETKSSGIGDISLLGVFGIVGSPAMTREQYVEFKPGFALGALVMVTAPTGEYDGDKAINLGTNRWAFRVGAPLGWSFGGSFLSPQLFRLEGHLTHNFNRAFWASIDLTANSGGETATDGKDDNNKKTWMGAGITAGINLSPAFGVTATYGEIISGNSSAPDGDGFRVNVRYTF